MPNLKRIVHTFVYKKREKRQINRKISDRLTKEEKTNQEN